jgi:hypothetical protein
MTIANIKESGASHWYLNGQPFYEVPYADPKKGLRKATLADARKVGALPSVTTVLRIMDKPALTAWKIEQAVLAVATSPRLPGELDDDFIKRVLSVDKDQDQERDAAAKLGTDIHAAIEQALSGLPYEQAYAVHVGPVIEACKQFGELVAVENIVTGKGYAGKTDAVFNNGKETTIVDFKTTKKLPKESHSEHRLQLAAYAVPVGASQVANIYISTTEPGKIAVCIGEEISQSFEAFNHALALWQWANNYRP